MAEIWICLRGLGRGNHHWGEFQKMFEAAKPQAMICWFEFAGNGERFHELSPLKVDAYVKDLRRQLEFAGHKGQRVNIFALSFGAMVALRWAELFPDEIEQLVLANTSHKAIAFFKRLRPNSWKHLIKIAASSFLMKHEFFKHAEKEVLEMTVNSTEQQKKYLKNWISYAEKHPVSLRNFLAQLHVARGVHFKNNPKVKITLITSVKDRMVSTKCSEAMAKTWNARLIKHPWGGHDLTLDDPASVVQILKEI